MVLSLDKAEVVRKVISQRLALLLGALTPNFSHSGVCNIARSLCSQGTFWSLLEAAIP